MKSTCQFTRPNDTTAYTAGDVVGGVLKFTGGASVQMDAWLTSADLRVDVSSIPSGMTSFRLHLYKEIPASAYADNAAWDLPAGDRNSYLGYIDLGSPADVGSTLWTQVDGLQKQFVMPGGVPLYGYLVTNGGFTPSASTVKTINLHITPVI